MSEDKYWKEFKEGTTNMDFWLWSLLRSFTKNNEIPHTHAISDTYEISESLKLHMEKEWDKNDDTRKNTESI